MPWLFLLLCLPGSVFLDTVPVIIENPRNISVIRNEPVTLNCKATGEPEPIIEWFKEGLGVKTAPQDPQSHRILLPDGSLFFLRAELGRKEQDSGTYWCRASNAAGTAISQNASIQIAYILEEFPQFPLSTSVSVGGNVTLKCSPPMGSPHPTVAWTKNDHKIQLKTSQNRLHIEEGGNLVIAGAVKDDTGWYRCEATNVAGTRTTQPVQIIVLDPPYFLSEPEDVVVVAGEDIELGCVVGGRPHPTITWSRQGLDIRKENSAVKEQGLSLVSVHPSDAGIYVCHAANKAGSISSSAILTVEEPPVISVKPGALHRVMAGKTIKLDCFVTGNPSPTVFWTREKDGETWYAGKKMGNVFMARNHTLILQNIAMENSGDYVCVGVSGAGAALERTLLVVNEKNPTTVNSSSETFTPNNLVKDLIEARVALVEKMMNIKTAVSESSTSIRLKWSLSGSRADAYLEGYFIKYREVKVRNQEYKSITVLHAGATSYSITRLRQFTQYEAFIQPFYKDVVGLPSKAVRVITLEEIPSHGPSIVNATFVNQTAIEVFWIPLDVEFANGILTKYQVSVSDNSGEVSSAWVNPSHNSLTLVLPFTTLHLPSLTARVAPVNKMGQGPFSDSLTVDMTRIFMEDRALIGREGEGEAWVAALVGSAVFLIILISGLAVYYRRQREKKIVGYLADQSNEQDEHSKEQSLWIDRRWGHVDSEHGSNSSEKKLLGGMLGGGSHTYATVQDNEYTYIDRTKLASFAATYAAREAEQQQMLAPYASTDIFKHNGGSQYMSGAVTSTPRPLAKSIYSSSYTTSTPISRYHHSTIDQLQPTYEKIGPRSNAIYGCGGAIYGGGDIYGGGAIYAKSNGMYAKSSGNLGYPNHQSTPGYAKISHRKKSGSLERPVNLHISDIIPPPPQQWATKPQDSVISPKYLFSQPTYSSPDITINRKTSNSKGRRKKSSHKIHPGANSYSAIPSQSSGPVRLARNDSIDIDDDKALGLDIDDRVYPHVINRDLIDEFNRTEKIPVSKSIQSSQPNILSSQISSNIPNCGQKMDESDDNGEDHSQEYLMANTSGITSDDNRDDESVDENYKSITDQALGGL